MAPYQDLKKISLTLVVDKTKNKVLYAEAGNEFVDVLLSFLTMELGTISKLVTKVSSVQPCKFNCINSLYQSIVNLHPIYFCSDGAKKRFLHKAFPMEACDGLKYNLASFVVYDDLKVTPCDVTTTLSIVQNFRDVQVSERFVVNISQKEVLDLLKVSIWSEQPLTDLFLLKTRHIKNCQTQFWFDTSDKIEEIKDGRKMKLKVMIETSKNKILFAQAEDDFVDQLLSFLTIPLGAVERLAKANSGLVCFDNLYKSVANLDGLETRYLGSLFSKLMSNFIDPSIIGPKMDNQMLPIPTMDLCPHDDSDEGGGGFVRQETTYMVTDDLWVQPFSCLAALSILRESKVAEDDLEERDILIGVNEVLGILKAALSSTSALTIGVGSYFSISTKRKRIRLEELKWKPSKYDP